jgi:hypothetical protein
MKFSREQLDSFIKLYKQEFGEKISREEAEKQATALVELVRKTYKPMTKEDLKKYLNL